MSATVTCEIHEGIACYRGGAEGRTWTCPACELLRAFARIEVLENAISAVSRQAAVRR